MQLSRLSEGLEIRIVGIILKLAALENGSIVTDWFSLDVFFRRIHIQWRSEVKNIVVENVAWSWTGEFRNNAKMQNRNQFGNNALKKVSAVDDENRKGL
jgi:hypothetical protein